MTAWRWRRSLVLAAGLMAVASVGLVLSGEASTSHAGTSASMALLTAASGLLLVSAGAVRTWTGRRASSGPLLLALGLVWWAPVWVGWDEGSALARSLAMVAAPFAPALLLHLASSLPAETVPSGALRRAVVAAYGITAAYSLTRAAVRDPFLDLYCWSNCSDNVFLIVARPGVARVLDAAGVAAGGLMALVAAAVALRRSAAGSAVGRRTRAPVLMPVALVATATAAHAVLLLTRPPEGPTDVAFAATYLLTGVSLAALGLGVAWLGVDERRRVRQLGDLAAEREPGGNLAVILARALGDRTVRVGYWLPDRVLVDRDGRRVPPDDDAAHVDIVRWGATVARVWCDPRLVDTARIAHEVGSAARVAVDNERLRAQMLASVRQLRESRMRVVETADAARRRLERDLHDGAQQRLLALTLQLTVAQARAAAAGDTARAEELRRAVTQAQVVVAELRTLAHGIYPAVLDQAGLDDALRSLAECASVPVTVERHAVSDSVPASAARVVFLAAREATQAGTSPCADAIRLAVSRTPQAVVLEVSPAFTPSTALDDRVGAAGGSLRCHDGMLQVEVPCE